MPSDRDDEAREGEPREETSEQTDAGEDARGPLKRRPGERVLDLELAAEIEETSPAAPREKHRHPHSE